MPVSLIPMCHHRLHIPESWNPRRTHPAGDRKPASLPPKTKQGFCFHRHKTFYCHRTGSQSVSHRPKQGFDHHLHRQMISRQVYAHRWPPQQVL
jgi:hypothetical protein